MKPKESRGNKVGGYDNCQTPPYALEPLLPYLKDSRLIWECAVGEGVLFRALDKHFLTLGTGITGGHDFLKDKPYDGTIVTNPPYSIKYQWLDRCIKLDRPFALLLPVETLGTKAAQKHIKKLDIMLLQPRVDFYMPEKGYEGGGAQFPTAWFTYGLNLPSKLTVGYLNKPKPSELKEYWRKALNE